ncbi:unnamed protein product [Phaeothamnion confervicola]
MVLLELRALPFHCGCLKGPNENEKRDAGQSLGEHEVLLALSTFSRLGPREPFFHVAVAAPYCEKHSERPEDEELPATRDNASSPYDAANWIFCRVMPEPNLDISTMLVHPWLFELWGLNAGDVLAIGAVTAASNDPTRLELPPLLDYVSLRQVILDNDDGGGSGSYGDIIGSESIGPAHLPRQLDVAAAVRRRSRGRLVGTGSLVAATLLGDVAIFEVCAVEPAGCLGVVTKATAVTLLPPPPLLSYGHERKIMTPAPGSAFAATAAAAEAVTPKLPPWWEGHVAGVPAVQMEELWRLCLLALRLPVFPATVSSVAAAAHSLAATATLAAAVSPRGILLSGPSGVGKSLLLTTLGNVLRGRHGVRVFCISGAEAMAQGAVGGGSTSYRGGRVAAAAGGSFGAVASAATAVAAAGAPTAVIIDDLDPLFDIIEREGGDAGALSEGAQVAAAVLVGLDSLWNGLVVDGEASNTGFGGKVGGGDNGDGDSDATTRPPRAVPPAFCKPARFSRCVELSPPTAAGRTAILHRLLTAPPLRLPPAATIAADHALVAESWSARLAVRTPGFVGGDLVRLVDTVHAAALARGAKPTQMAAAAGTTVAGRARGDGRATIADFAAPAAVTAAAPVVPSDAAASWADVESALACVSPRQLAGLAVEAAAGGSGGGVGGASAGGWADVGGYDEVKRRLERLVRRPWEHPAAYVRMGLPPASGVLLTGPSGCGKSLVAAALAASCRANFVRCRAGDLLSSYLGQSEAAVRALFARARAAAPCILFFDELDALAGSRGFGGDGGGEADGVMFRVLSTLLNEMDGVARSGGANGSSSGEGEGDGSDGAAVVVLAATNRPEALDAALLRPGRLQESVELGMPAAADRAAVLAVHTRRTPLATDVDLPALAATAALSGGLTCAELAAACREACLAALREDVGAAEVAQRHLAGALAARQRRATTAPV